MTKDDYKVWVKHHATLFMMAGEADVALFEAWKPLVLPYALQDFVDGSNYLATDKASTFRTTHLDHIRQRINASRMELARRRQEQENAAMERHECQVCHGIGVVSVPHFGFVRDMEWLPPYPTFGIFCFCALGRSRFDSLTDGVREAKNSGKPSPGYPFEWAKYEALVPNWSELLQSREEMRLAEMQAEGLARHADTVSPLRKIFDSILASAEIGDLQ